MRSRRAGTRVSMVPVWTPSLISLRSGLTRRRSRDRARRIDGGSGAGQIAVHPRNLAPASELPFNAGEAAGIFEPHRSVKRVADLIGLRDSGEGPSVAALAEPIQESGVGGPAAATALVVAFDVQAGLGRPAIRREAP